MRDKRIFEIVAVAVTALGKFIFYDLLNQQLTFIILMFLFWGFYISKRIKNQKDILREWGFRLDNFKSIFKIVAPFGVLTLSICFLVGHLQDTININWHLIPILLLYPLFGTLQQFLLMALVAGNLQSLERFSKPVIILTSSFLFGIIHYPDWWLVFGTFLLALFYSYIYLKNRNLYVLGIFHGWLGAIFYYTVVNKDPFLEVFGSLLK